MTGLSGPLPTCPPTHLQVDSCTGGQQGTDYLQVAPLTSDKQGVVTGSILKVYEHPGRQQLLHD